MTGAGGRPLVAAFDAVMGFGRVVKSAISEQSGAVQFDLEGLGFDDDPTSARSEVKPAQEVFGPLGSYGRPLEPASSGQDQFAEYLAARTSDGLVAFGFRDRRILEMMAKGASGDVPKVGQLMTGGYGGAFLSFEYEADELRDQTTLYVPYERDGSGVPTKAHMLSIGVDANGTPLLAVISGEGPRLTLLGTEAVLSNADGSARLEVNGSGVTAVGPFKAPQGADLGGAASVPVALAPAIVAWAGLVTTWQLQVTGAVNGLAPGSITAPTTPLASPAATVTKGF